MKILRKNKLLFSMMIFVSLAPSYYLNADGKSVIVQPESHDIQNGIEANTINSRIDEITHRLKDKNLSSSEKTSLKKERKELKKRKGEILMKKIGIDPDVKGPVAYEN